MNHQNKKKVGIVGAGPGGLAAGMLLAKKGFKVSIFEAKDRVGGRNGSIESQGFTFDIGPTFFMMPFVLEQIFKATGRKMADYLDLDMLKPFYQLVFADGKKLKTSYDGQAFKDSIAGINPQDADGYDPYMRDNRKKIKYTLPVLQRPYSKYADVLNMDTLRLLTVLNPQRSIWADLGRYFSDGRVKVGFTFQSKYLGMSPFRCPSLFSILPFIEYNWGIYHIKGGLHKLSWAMAEVVKEEGGAIHIGEPVEEVLIQNGQSRGLKLADGSTRKFDEVVLNADFAWSMKHLISKEKRKKYTDENLDKKNYSCSTFMLYLGMDRTYDNLEHHNVFIARDYEKNFLEIESDKELSSDPSFYVHHGAKTDPSVAPKGKSALYVLVPVANLQGKIDWAAKRDSFKDMVLDKLGQKIGDPEFRKHIIYEKTITPQDWHDEYNIGYGATFNLGHNLRQMLMFRPRNDFEEFQNMWLVGGGTHPGSGLPTIYESGRITANLIFKKYGLDYTFRHTLDI